MVAILKLPQPGLIPTLDFAFSVDDVDEALDIRNPERGELGRFGKVDRTGAA
jgi:hypothetical protein